MKRAHDQQYAIGADLWTWCTLGTSPCLVLAWKSRAHTHVQGSWGALDVYRTPASNSSNYVSAALQLLKDVAIRAHIGPSALSTRGNTALLCAWPCWPTS